MKKVSYYLSLAAVASMVALSGCNNTDPDPDPDPTTTCADLVYPTATGDADIQVLNFASSTIEVEAGNVLALAVQATKGSNRTQKLRLWASDCENSLGTEVDLTGQPKGGKNGIDLRNTDDPQVRNVNYTVPTGMNPIYLTIETDESGGNVNYKQLTLNVTGSGIVDTWSSIDLGGNTNSLPSRMASGTGQTYVACDAAENIQYIDITYAVGTASPYDSYLCSNPARFLSPIGLTVSNATGCDADDPTGTTPTDGGNKSHFKTSTMDFATATNDSLTGLSVSASDPEYVVISAVGDVFEFMSEDGRKGLIKVDAEDATYGLMDGRGSITVSVKIQR